MNGTNNIKRTLAALAVVVGATTMLTACDDSPTDDPTTSAVQESMAAAMPDELSEEQISPDWQRPTWNEDSYAYAAEVLQLLNNAANQGLGNVRFVDDAGNLEEFFFLAGLANAADLMIPFEGDEADACGNTAADGHYTQWCSADDNTINTVSVFYENITAAMSADKAQAEIDIVADQLVASTNIVLGNSGLEMEIADRSCVAGAIMGALAEHKVWAADEESAIRDVYFKATAAEFDEGYESLTCTIMA